MKIINQGGNGTGTIHTHAVHNHHAGSSEWSKTMPVINNEEVNVYIALNIACRNVL
jgi:hypothetical protein